MAVWFDREENFAVGVLALNCSIVGGIVCCLQELKVGGGAAGVFNINY